MDTGKDRQALRLLRKTFGNEDTIFQAIKSGKIGCENHTTIY